MKKRAQKRRKLSEKLWEEVNEEAAVLEEVNEVVDEEKDVEDGVGVQTDLSGDLPSCQDFEKLQLELEEVKRENDALKKDLFNHKSETRMTEECFRDNDKLVLYYTGLSTWELLYTLFLYIKPNLMTRSSLSPFQQLLLVLMRLRLNLQLADIGFRFNIHYSTVSRIFLRVLDVLFVKLKPLIIWPDRDILKKTMPMTFRKHFPKCIAIIDCFEIFLDRPTNLLARAQTYSNYKHHNTVKYLIAISPQGTVSYISQGWGGRASDKYITEHSTLLDNLVPGDTLLADRGFNISDSVGLHCSRLEIPAFTKGKKQLEGIAVEQTRNIANVRIHVERVIGNIRNKYSMLSCTQPIDFVISSDGTNTTLDKIVLVSCALVNICESVVPFE